MQRREFLKLSCVMGAGMLVGGMGLNLSPITAHAATLKKTDRVRAAHQTTSICCYCAVGCGLVCSTDKKTGTIINIEGDPEHPINEGSLCAKGAGIFQTTAANKNRLTKVLYRAPFSDHWEEKTWDFAIKRISENIKKERDASFMLSNKDGARVNRLETIGQMGSSNLDSEECWNIAAFARTLGLVYLEHQARV